MNFRNLFFPSPNAGDQYLYNIEDPHSLNYLENAHLELFRAKRDVNVPQSPPPQPQPPPPASQPASSAGSSVSIAPTPDKVPLTETPKVDNAPRLLGVNGTGQRKDISTLNGTKAPDVVPQQPTISNSKTSAINKSLGAAQSTKPIESVVPDDEEKLIDEIDEPEETINKTVGEHYANQTQKTDYFQYYNSTTTTDKNKSDEYWAVNKDYIVSSILSKSHRRAIVREKENGFRAKRKSSKKTLNSSNYSLILSNNSEFRPTNP